MTAWTDIQNILLNYLLVATVVAAVLPPAAWLVARVGRVRSAVHRHLIWLWCIIGIAALPLVWVCAPKMALPILPGPAAKVVSRVSHGLVGSPALPVVTPRVSSVAPAPEESDLPPAVMRGFFVTKLSWPVVLTGVWAVGVAFMLVRLGVGMRQVARIAARAESVPDWAEKLGLPFRPARLLLSDAVAGPACYGLRRPTIILPRHSWQDGDMDELRMILRHEMAHVRRRDPWVNLLQRLVEAVLFFHPGVWIASRQLTQQREVVCDNWVLADGAAPDAYAGVLARVAEAAMSSRLHAAALVEGRLVQRVRSLLSREGFRSPRASTRAWLLGSLAGLLLLGGFGVVRLGAAPGTLVIQVVDEAGQPVAGARIVPWGLRAMPNSASSYGWNERFSYGVPPRPAFTDAQGQASLSYPMQIRLPYEGVETDMDTCAIILAVYHPEYAPTVEQTYPTGTQVLFGRGAGPIVLHRGAVLRLSGYIGSPDKTVPGLVPQVSNCNFSFEEVVRYDKDVCIFSGLPAGPHYVRLVCCSKEGERLFSEPVLVEAEVGRTYTHNLELKPAIPLRGRVDDSVPRPVRNGYVQVRVSYPTELNCPAGYVYWDDWARIGADGTFQIDGLPRGTVQVIGVCDEYSWEIGGADRQAGYAVSALSQAFEPQAGGFDILLKMQPAATFEVHVVDPDGRPIEGAKVQFITAARWFSSRAQVVDPLMRTADLPPFVPRAKGPYWSWVHYYEAVTDAAGVAIVHNLPAYGEPQWPQVEHAAYERVWPTSTTKQDMADRIAVPGEYKRVTVTMRPRGSASQPWARETAASVPAPDDGQRAPGTQGTAQTAHAAKEQAEEPASDWRKEFDRVYRLEDGEVFKRIAPPFIPSRLEYYRQWDSDQAKLIPEGPDSMQFGWNGQLRDGVMSFMSRGPELRDVMSLLGFERYEYEGPKELLELVVTGDWIVRDGASQAERMAGLERILRDQLNAPIHFERRTVEREAIVARGTYEFHTNDDVLPSDRRSVNIYADTADPTGGGRTRGTLAELLGWIGDRLNMPVVNETETAGPARINWRDHRSSYLRDMPDGPEKFAKVDMVLKHLAEQTSLTWTRERREVAVWTIERSEPPRDRGR